MIFHCGSCIGDVHNGTLTISPENGESGIYNGPGDLASEFKSGITKIEILPGVILGDSTYAFGFYHNLKQITGLENLDISKVDSLWGMFIDDEKLKSVDLTSWKTPHITSMGFMFAGCKKLKEIDLSSFSFDNVESMEFMFYNCRSLKKVDFGAFAPNTEKLNNISSLFMDCRNLESLDLSDWITSAVTDCNMAFKGCRKLKDLNISGWEIKDPCYSPCMFMNCEKLKDADLSGFSVSEYCQNMFTNCGIPEEKTIKFSSAENVIKVYLF